MWNLQGIRKIDNRLVLRTESGRTEASESTTGRTLPTLEASLQMKRLSSAYIWNIVLPIGTLTSMGYFCSGVPTSDASFVNDRLAITLQLMLTAVAYKFTAGQGARQR